MNDIYPTLKGETLFRPHEAVYLNKSIELEEYCHKMHKHDFIELAYVISGKALHRVGNYHYEVTQGDLFIINYDVPHGFTSQPGNDEAPILYNCVFRPEFLDASLFRGTHFENITSSFLFGSLFPENFAPTPDLRLHGTDFLDVGDLFSKMYAEYQWMKKGYLDLIRAYLIELIVKIFRLLESGGKKNISSHHRQLVDQAIDYLKRNFQSEIKLSDLAMQSFVSKNYFSKLFKEVTGINLSDYIQRLRINEACNLLRNTDMKMVDIALEVGFNDLTFFYEVFKRMMGKTPGDYREVTKA